MFGYCLDGQLLYIAPSAYDTGKLTLTREKCWEMNALALLICSLGIEDDLKISRG